MRKFQSFSVLFALAVCAGGGLSAEAHPRPESQSAVIVPASTAAQLPTSLGLHHHGVAPESAGYTIGELGRLQRSVVPAQRCVAHQTLGRILFRLGKGDFGPEGTELAEGMWTVVARERVIESAVAEAGRGMGAGTTGGFGTGAAAAAEGAPAPGADRTDESTTEQDADQMDTNAPVGGSRSAWALATEAVWLWQRGGGRGGEEFKTR